MFSVCCFKPLSYCLEETIGLNVKTSFIRRLVSRVIKPGDIRKEFYEKAIHIHGTLHGLKITNCFIQSFRNGIFLNTF